MASQSSGTLGAIIRNDVGLYEGDLRHYFKAVFENAQNLQKPYHNFRHMFHVVWLCYQACLFYQGIISKTEMRNLLIAAMFHDFDHPGMMGNDDLNVERAVRAFQKYCLSEDILFQSNISYPIQVTEYPYKTDSSKLALTAQIIRDADMGQGFSTAWIQQVVIGLAEEWGKRPIDLLRLQVGFLEKLEFHTEWGQEMFPQRDIEAKINEVQQLSDLLK